MSGQPVINEVEKKPSLGLYERTAAPPVWRMHPSPQTAPVLENTASSSRGWQKPPPNSKNFPPKSSFTVLVATEHPLLGCRWGSAPQINFLHQGLDFFSPICVILHKTCFVKWEIQGNWTTPKVYCGIWVKLERSDPRTNLHLMHCA